MQVGEVVVVNGEVTGERELQALAVATSVYLAPATRFGEEGMHVRFPRVCVNNYIGIFARDCHYP